MMKEEKQEIFIEPLQDEEEVKQEKKPKKKYTVSQKVIDRNNLARRRAIEQRIKEREALVAINAAREIVKKEKKVKEPVRSEPARDEGMLLAKSNKKEQEEEPVSKIETPKKEEPKKRPCRKDRFH